jgi:hypothetical protein
MAGQKVKAIYEYASQEPDDLSFPIGQVITITEEIDADWYEGEYTDAVGNKQSGIFPNNFVEKYEPEVPVRPTRAARPKSVIQPAPAPAREEVVEPQREPEPKEESEDEQPEPPLPAAPKPQPPPVEIPAIVPRKQEDVRSPQSATSQKAPVARNLPPPVSQPTPAEPPASESRKPPPPIAPKSNAFKDRIAAFNAPAAAAPMPFKPTQSQPGGFIKKPFVAPPPSSNAYVPPPKHEPVVKPYHRDEDPEIRQRQEDDTAAAEAAGFAVDGQAAQDGEAEDAPKPQSLKERIAMLQQQQAEQAQRRAGGGAVEKKERKPPAKKPSEPVPGQEDEELDRVRSPGVERQSLDMSRERPRVPSTQRRPQDPMSVTPAVPQHEIIDGGNEADLSAAGETEEDETDTIGAEDDDERPLPPSRISTAPKADPDADDEQEETEGGEEAEEDSMDEDERRRMELRERMAKMSGGMGMAGMFGAPMPMPGAGTPKKRTASSKEKQASGSHDQASPQQRAPMVPIPGMQRVQSPQAEERRSLEVDDRGQQGGFDAGDAPPQPPTRTSTSREERGAPPVPQGKHTLVTPPCHSDQLWCSSSYAIFLPATAGMFSY